MAIGISLRSTVQDQHGSVLLGTLMLTVALTAIGFALFDIANVERFLVVGNQKESQALYAAEAGVSQVRLFWEKGLISSCGAVAAMPAFDTVWGAPVDPPTQLCTNAAFGPATFNSVTATYTVTATKSTNACVTPALPAGATSINAYCVTVVSTACLTPADPKAPCVSAQADLVKVLTLTQTSSSSPSTTSSTITIAKYPFFASDYIGLNSGQVVDSFDSKAGPYAVSKCRAVGCGADMWTNGLSSGTVEDNFNKVLGIYGNVTLAKGQIVLGSSGVIYGNVTYDTTNASIDCGAGCVPTHVKGTVTATTVTPVDMASVMPPVPNCINDVGAIGGTDAQDPTRNHTTGYTKVSPVTGFPVGATLNSGTATAYDQTTGFWDTRKGSITLNPGTYCFGGPKFGDVAIPTSPTQPVVVKLNSDTIFTGSLVNSTGVSAYLQILSSVDSSSNGVSIGSGSDSYIYIYAPRALVLVNGHGDIFGAVESRVLKSTGTANLHFDKDLGRPGNPLAGGSQITVYTTTTTTTVTTTTKTNYARQLWRVCPSSGCA